MGKLKEKMGKGSLFILIFVIFIIILLLDRGNFSYLVSLTFKNLLKTTPHILFAIFLIAYLKAIKAEKIIANSFKGKEGRMIVLAAFLGGLAPFCSCQIIPLIAGLLALGTPLSAIMALWISSPLNDPATFIVTAGVIGFEFALAKGIIAVSLGLISGFIVNRAIKAGFFRNPTKSYGAKKGGSSCSEEGSCGCSNESATDDKEGSCCGESSESSKPLWKFWKEKGRVKLFRGELYSNSLFLFKWMLLAYTLESLMIQYIPAERVASIVGGEGASPIVISALLGIPAYVNTYAALPLLSGLLEQGMSIGAAMAFMIGGAVTSIPAMTAVFALVRRSIFALYLAIGLIGAVLAGLIVGVIL